MLFIRTIGLAVTGPVVLMLGLLGGDPVLGTADLVAPPVEIDLENNLVRLRDRDCLLTIGLSESELLTLQTLTGASPPMEIEESYACLYPPSDARLPAASVVSSEPGRIVCGEATARGLVGESSSFQFNVGGLFDYVSGAVESEKSRWKPWETAWIPGAMEKAQLELCMRVAWVRSDLIHKMEEFQAREMLGLIESLVDNNNVHVIYDLLVEIITTPPSSRIRITTHDCVLTITLSPSQLDTVGRMMKGGSLNLAEIFGCFGGSHSFDSLTDSDEALLNRGENELEVQCKSVDDDGHGVTWGEYKFAIGGEHDLEAYFTSPFVSMRNRRPIQTAGGFANLICGMLAVNRRWLMDRITRGQGALLPEPPAAASQAGAGVGVVSLASAAAAVDSPFSLRGDTLRVSDDNCHLDVNLRFRPDLLDIAARAISAGSLVWESSVCINWGDVEEAFPVTFLSRSQEGGRGHVKCEIHGVFPDIIGGLVDYSFDASMEPSGGMGPDMAGPGICRLLAASRGKLIALLIQAQALDPTSPSRAGHSIKVDVSKREIAFRSHECSVAIRGLSATDLASASEAAAAGALSWPTLCLDASVIEKSVGWDWKITTRAVASGSSGNAIVSCRAPIGSSSDTFSTSVAFSFDMQGPHSASEYSRARGGVGNEDSATELESSFRRMCGSASTGAMGVMQQLARFRMAGRIVAPGPRVALVDGGTSIRIPEGSCALVLALTHRQVNLVANALRTHEGFPFPPGFACLDSEFLVDPFVGATSEQLPSAHGAGAVACLPKDYTAWDYYVYPTDGSEFDLRRNPERTPADVNRLACSLLTAARRQVFVAITMLANSQMGGPGSALP